ncbi:MAG: putative vanillate demethylase reductase subunit [Nocardioidaceae bacterium]|nr:putative vanillate demethylase reductase subunit [Nocardioidaceae bacterium]
MLLEVADRRLIADRVLEVEVADPRGAELPAWTPGAHVDLVLSSGHVRQYSLVSRPDERTRFRFAVLLESGGRGGSRWIHDNLVPGDRLDVRGPRNHFQLEPATAYRFVAGGIGITPILPMVEQVARAGIPFELLYGARSRSAMAYRARVEALGDRAHLVAQDEDGVPDLARFLGDPEPGVLVYACGPPSLLDAVAGACAGWRPGSLQVERFNLGSGTPTAPSPSDHVFEARLDASGVEVTVAADETLLAALERVGADLLSDCREGICGTCEVGVLSGAVDHRDSVLSARERDAGDVMMACVSRAREARIVLDL